MNIVNGQHGFVDIHNHCLFGIDDGAVNYQSTCNMLMEAVNDGIMLIVTTPHIIPGTKVFDYEGYEKAFTMAYDYIRERKLHLSLIKGHEILYTNSTVRYLDEGFIFPLGNSGTVLVEFYPDDSEKRIFEGVRQLVGNGYQPVLAHIERCQALHRSDQIQKLKDEGALIQMNAHTLLHKHSLLRQRYIDNLLSKGLVDIIASDAHDMPGRWPRMTRAFDLLTRRFGMREALRLCRDNAQDILSL